MGHLALHLGDEVVFCLLGGEAGDALKLLGLALLDALDILLGPVGVGMLLGQGLLFTLNVLCFPV